jgi:hypothetical protein
MTEPADYALTLPEVYPLGAGEAFPTELFGNTVRLISGYAAITVGVVEGPREFKELWSIKRHEYEHVRRDD